MKETIFHWTLDLTVFDGDNVSQGLILIDFIENGKFKPHEFWAFIHYSVDRFVTIAVWFNQSLPDSFSAKNLFPVKESIRLNV